MRADRVLEPLGADAFVDDGLHLSGRAYKVLLRAVADAVHDASGRSRVSPEQRYLWSNE